MSMKHCISCLKMLPADESGELCTLCALGFVPAKETPKEEHAPLAADAECGARCPFCVSALRFRDLALGFCPVCSGVLNTMPANAGVDATAQAEIVALPRGGVTVRRNLGEMAWPDEAPTR